MPHFISLAASMNLEHSIKEESHERYPVHLQCLRNIKKIKYPDFQAVTRTDRHKPHQQTPMVAPLTLIQISIYCLADARLLQVTDLHRGPAIISSNRSIGPPGLVKDLPRHTVLPPADSSRCLSQGNTLGPCLQAMVKKILPGLHIPHVGNVNFMAQLAPISGK